jgi:hypothetical protein
MRITRSVKMMMIMTKNAVPRVALRVALGELLSVRSTKSQLRKLESVLGS